MAGTCFHRDTDGDATVWNRLSEGISADEVIDALVGLFKSQYAVFKAMNLGIPDSPGEREESFNRMKQMYDDLRKLMDDDVFRFLVSGDPYTDKEEISSTIEDGWRKILSLK